MITADRLKELLNYDPDTGKLVWLVNRRGRFARIGQEAGTKQDDAIYVGLDGKIYSAHRLIWLYVHGNWPEGHYATLEEASEVYLKKKRELHEGCTL